MTWERYKIKDSERGKKPRIDPGSESVNVVIRVGKSQKPAYTATGTELLRSAMNREVKRYLKTHGVDSAATEEALVSAGLLCPECGRRAINFRCARRCGTVR